jgi:translocation and assembly module TamB
VKYPRLAVGLGVLAALLAMVCWLLLTTSGLQFIVARALPHLPLTLDTASLEGRLVGPLSSGRIELDAPGVRGSIERVKIDWRLAALWHRTLHLRNVEIEAPRLVLDPQPREDTEPDPDAGPFELPLSIIVDRLVLHGGSVDSDGVTVVDGLQLELAGRAGGQEVQLDRLEVSSTQGRIAGRARASTAANDPWDVDVAWQLTFPEGPVAGHTRIVGEIGALEIEQDISAPLMGRIEGTVSGLPAAPAWQLELQLEPLPAEGGPWPPILEGLAARLSIGGRLEQSIVSGDFEIPEIIPGRIGIDMEAGWEDAVATLGRLDLDLADGGRLRGSGQVTPGEVLTADFALEGTGLGWPLAEPDQALLLPRLVVRGSGVDDRWRFDVDGLARLADGELPPIELTAMLTWAESMLAVEQLQLVSPEGELHASAEGTLDLSGDDLSYRGMAEVDLRLPDYPPVSARFGATGDGQGVRVDSLVARLLGGTLEGAGRIAWEGEDEADFRLTFADLDPASLAPDWPGRLAGVVALRGLPTTSDGLEIALSSVSGEIRSLPVSGQAALNVSEGRLLLRRAALGVGSASLQAAGRLDDETLALDASLEVPSLEALDSEARGSLTATARVEGARDAPRITLEATGAGLRRQGMRVRELKIDADVDLSGAQASRVNADLQGFATAPGPGAELRLEAAGTPASHNVRLEFDRSRPEQEFVLALAGGVTDAVWAGQIMELTVDEEQLQVWALRQPALLSASAAHASLGNACMEGTLGLLCLQAAWDRDGPWRGRASLLELDLGPLSDWLLEGLSTRGIVTGQIIVEADDQRFRAVSGGLDLTAGDIRLAEEGSSPLIAWTGGALRLAGDESEARATLQLSLAGGDLVEGNLAVGWNAPDPPLEGRLEAVLEQLQLITELFPELADIEGRATLQGTLSGTASAPQVLGRFAWTDGQAQIPALNLRPENIDVVAELNAGQLTFTAGGRSGDGSFEADGRFDLRGETLEGTASLKGTDLLLVNLTDARITATPDLQLTYAGQTLVIGGEVDIPFGRISGIGAPGAVTTSPDEVLVGPRAPTANDALTVSSRIRVSVGPDVQVQASGLRGSVEGTLLTVTQPQALPWGRGELRVVDGTFSALGQRLEIETGRLIYTGGPLENPGLEIRAVRKVDEVTAGALVRGTLQQPEISIYSDPPMPRAEALSYLTLGKGLDELQAGEQSTIDQAANSLALSGGGLIARDLGRRLGFDDVAVTADDDAGGASVVFGKHLGGGLFVSYGLGLFDTVNTLRLRYQINPRLSLEAISGAEAAADLFYTFERD